MINYNILSTLHYFMNAVLHHQRFFTPATLLYIVNASSHYQCCIQKWNRDLTELHHVMQSCIREFCPTTNSISKKSFCKCFMGCLLRKYLKIPENNQIRWKHFRAEVYVMRKWLRRVVASELIEKPVWLILTWLLNLNVYGYFKINHSFKDFV